MNGADPQQKPPEEVENQTPSPGDAAADPAATTPADPNVADKASARIAELEQQIATIKDQALRALAEAENTRKRALKDREDASKYAVTSFAKDLLDYTDNFKRALDAIPDELKNSGDDRIKNLMVGLAAMQRQLLSTLEKHGIKKIDPMGEAFNPNFHEVMFEVPGSGKPAGTVMQVVDTGFVIHDRLLRPARVGIAKDEGQGSVHKIDKQA